METADSRNCKDRASGNGSRGETPCAGAGAALAPARVWAAAQAQQKEITKKEKKKRVPEQLRSSLQWERQVPRSPKGSSRSFRAGDEVRPRWKRQIRTTPRIAPVPCSCRMTQGNDLIRPRCARPPSPKRGRLHARCRLTNAEAASSRNLRPIRTHNTAVRPASRFTGRLFPRQKRAADGLSAAPVVRFLGACAVVPFPSQNAAHSARKLGFSGERKGRWAAAQTCAGANAAPAPAQGASPLDPFYAGAFPWGWLIMRPPGCSGLPIPSPAAPPAARRWWAPHP